jgi:hypothetical protein
MNVWLPSSDHEDDPADFTIEVSLKGNAFVEQNFPPLE